MTLGDPNGINYRLIAWLTMGLLTIMTCIALVATRPAPLPTPRAEVKGAILELEVARTPSQQTRGLSGHAPLAWHQAMYFPRMASSDRQCFWMKDMTFAIDIAWIDGSDRIVQLEERFEPASYPQAACGPAGTRGALELRAGSADYFSLERGDHVLLTL